MKTNDMTSEQLEARQTFALEIAGKKFCNWSEIELDQSIDGFSSVGFTAPFEPERKEFRDLFRPFSYERVRVFLGDELQFTGQLVNVEPSFDGHSRSVRVQCSALPTVLADCTLPGKLQGQEGDKSSFLSLYLLAIAQELCLPYGFTARFFDARSALINLGQGLTTDQQGDAFTGDIKAREALQAAFEKRFGRVKVECDQKIHDFLCMLANQRGVVMTDDPAGNLVFQRSVPTGRAQAAFKEGLPPLVSVTPTFNPQEYYSQITAVVPKKRGQKGSRHTVVNPLLKDSRLVRPLTFQANDTDPGEAPAAANAKLGRMFGNVVSWELEVPTFLDPQGEFLRPNTTVTVKAPSAMIYGNHELLVRRVVKRQDANSSSCKLTLVLPGAFSGEAPPSLPWDEALT